MTVVALDSRVGAKYARLGRSRASDARFPCYSLLNSLFESSTPMTLHEERHQSMHNRKRRPSYSLIARNRVDYTIILSTRG